MKELGYRAVMVWLKPEELELVQAAAGRSALATWIKSAAVQLAHSPGGGVRIERVAFR